MNVRNTFLVLALLIAVPAGADFDAGLEAARSGDFVAALREWRPLAVNGNAGAQYNLGLMYAQGEGVAQDDGLAADWFRRAAAQGLAAAQYNLGIVYAAGRGVPHDDLEAAAWYRKAAEQGHTGAQNNLGVMYRYGLGVVADPILAAMLFELASADDELARESLRQLSADLKPEQVARAKALASAWAPGKPLPTATAADGAAPSAAQSIDQSCPPGGDEARRFTDHCIEGNCLRSYANGCTRKFQAPYCYDNKSERWDWKPDGC